jgi:hypothetical protein
MRARMNEVMSPIRGVAIVVVTGGVAAWLVSPATTSAPPRSRFERPDARAATAPRLFDYAEQRLRLRQRVTARERPARSSRDPFRFGRGDAARSATAPPVVPPVRRAAPPEETGDAGTPPAACPFTLIGMAERRTADGLERVAVVSGLGQLFLVSAGELATARCEVAAVTADAIELVERPSGRTTRLTLPR